MPASTRASDLAHPKQHCIKQYNNSDSQVVATLSGRSGHTSAPLLLDLLCQTERFSTYSPLVSPPSVQVSEGFPLFTLTALNGWGRLTRQVASVELC